MLIPPASELLSQQVNHQTPRKLHTYGTDRGGGEGGWYLGSKLILGELHGHLKCLGYIMNDKRRPPYSKSMDWFQLFDL